MTAPGFGERGSDLPGCLIGEAQAWDFQGFCAGAPLQQASGFMGPAWGRQGGNRTPYSHWGKGTTRSSSSPDRESILARSGQCQAQPGSCGLGQASRASRELECQMGAEQEPSHMPALAHRTSLNRKACLQGTWVPKSFPLAPGCWAQGSRLTGPPPPLVTVGPRL